MMKEFKCETVESLRLFPLVRNDWKLKMPVSDLLMIRLKQTGRVIQCSGALPISRIEEEAYAIMRNRQTSSFGVHPVDIVTTEPVRRNLRATMAKYFEAKYGNDLTRMMLCTDTIIGECDQYQFPAVRIAVFSCGENDPPALWILHWPDITEQFEIMTPNHHCLIRGFSGFSL